jgi:hypothetical protein
VRSRMAEVGVVSSDQLKSFGGSSFGNPRVDHDHESSPSAGKSDSQWQEYRGAEGRIQDPDGKLRTSRRSRRLLPKASLDQHPLASRFDATDVTLSSWRATAL